MVSEDGHSPPSARDGGATVARFYKLVFDNAPTVIVVVGDDGYIVFVNRAGAAQNGLSPEAIIGRHVTDIFTPSAAAGILVRNRDFLANGAGRVQLQRVEFKGGACRYYETIRVAVDHPLHDRPCVMLIADDVTEQEEMAEELRRSEERYRRLVETGPMTVTVIDRDLVLRFANRRAAAQIGREPEDIVDRQVKELFGPDVAAATRRDLEHVLCTGKCLHITYDWRAPDDSVRHFDLTMQPYPDAEPPTSVLIIGHDITDLREAERERRRLAAAADGAVDGIMLVGPEGRVDYVNRAFLQQRELDRDDVVGRLVWDLPGLDDPGVNDRIRERLDGGESWTGIIGTRDSRGRERQWGVAITPVRDGHGEVVDYVAVYRDRRVEQELAERLARARRLEALGELAGKVAHEFRGLLHLVVIQAEQGLATPAAAVEHLRQILRTAEQGQALAENILSFGRREDGPPHRVRLHLVVSEVLGLLRTTVPDHVHLLTEADTDVGVIHANETQIHQILINLCRNAWQALERAESGTISVRLYATEQDGEDGVCIEVADDGPGMDDEMCQRIFEPYVTGRQERGGTGLGLAVVRGIVDALGGRITVESEPGAGAMFRVWLPLAAPPVPPAPTAAQSVRRVVALSADGQMRELLRAVFAETRVEGQLVSGEQELLEVLGAQADVADLVVIDISASLPDLVSLGRQIWRYRSGQPMLVLIPVGFLSAVERVRVETFARVLEKPLRLAELEAAVGITADGCR